MFKHTMPFIICFCIIYNPIHAATNKHTNKISPTGVLDGIATKTDTDSGARLNKLDGRMNIPDIAHVEKFTGELRVKLPLINVPENDGIQLKVTFTHNLDQPSMVGFGTRAKTGNGALRRNYYKFIQGNKHGYHWYSFTGLVSNQHDIRSTMPWYLPLKHPIFIDPDGVRHDLYPNKYGYQSKDNWLGHLTTYGNRYEGTVISPDGTQYKMRHMSYADDYHFRTPLETIVSPHGASKITYRYNGDLSVHTISDGSYYLRFNYNAHEGNTSILSSINDNLHRKWVMNYQSYRINYITNDYFKNVNELRSITLPDRTRWQFTYKTMSDDMLPITRIINPLGKITDYTYFEQFHLLEGNTGNYLEREFGTRHTPVYINSVIQRAAAHVTPATWQYRYSESTWDGQNKMANRYYGRKEFGGKTTVYGPFKKTIYQFNHEADAANYLTMRGANTFWTTLYPLATPLTGSLKSVDIYENSTGKRLRAERYHWGLRKISSQKWFLKAIHHLCTPEPYSWPYRPGRGIQAPILLNKTIYQDGTAYKTVYSTPDEFGQMQTVIETGNHGKQRILRYSYVNNKHKWILGQVSLHTIDGIGRVYENTYNADGLVTQHKDYGTPTKFTYQNGLLHTKIDAAGHTTTFANYKHGTPQLITFADNSHITRKVNLGGTIASETDALGKTIQYMYDTMQRVIRKTPAAGNPTTYSYNRGNLGRVIISRGALERTITLNGIGQTISIKEHDSSSGAVRHKYFRYDANGLERFHSYAFQASTSLGVYSGYDALGRKTAISYPYANGSLNHQIVFHYLANNAVQKTIRQKETTMNTFQSYGDPNQKWLVDIKMPSGSHTAIARDVAGHILSITQGAYKRSVSYDSHYFVKSKTDPETGMTEFTYNPLGLITKSRISGSDWIHYDYDIRNRLHKVTYPDNSPTLEKDYDAKGRLTKLIKGNVKTSYQYDSNDNLFQETLTIGNNAYLIHYHVNANDVVESITYPNNKTIHLKPNGFALPTKIGAYITGVQYHAGGQVRDIHYANGLNTHITLNGFKYPETISITGNKKTLGRRYVYYKNNNIKHITDLDNTKFNLDLSYDADYRLKQIHSGYWGDETIQYDNVNNINAISRNGHSNQYHYDAHNRLKEIAH